jgi:hypothetical protein
MSSGAATAQEMGLVHPAARTRYRSDSQNPDFGDMLPPAIPGLAAGQFPAIPRGDDDLGLDGELTQTSRSV